MPANLEIQDIASLIWRGLAPLPFSAESLTVALRIECPNCGSRPYTEFSFGAEAPGAVGDESWSDRADYERVWLRRNVAGSQLERWFHATGCRRWLTLERDTTTNEIHAVH